jgi:hypothetical protein
MESWFSQDFGDENFSRKEDQKGRKNLNESPFFRIFDPLCG